MIDSLYKVNKFLKLVDQRCIYGRLISEQKWSSLIWIFFHFVCIFVNCVCICVNVYIFYILLYTHFDSYQILNPKGIVGIEDPKKCTKILIESTELDPDQYRLGNTKACVQKSIIFSLNFQSNSNAKEKRYQSILTIVLIIFYQ